MNILITIPTLEIGGAEIFLVRLLNYFAEQKNVKVFLLDFEKEKRDPEITKLFSKKIKLLDNPIGNTFLKRALGKLELIFKLGKEALSFKFYSYFLKKLILKYNIDLIHSHLYRSDRIVSRCVHGTPAITTLHGCYNSFGNDRLAEMFTILNSFRHLIYIADLNLTPLERSEKKETLLNKTVKIYNGLNIDTNPTVMTRSSHGTLKLAVVSRCIKEKGWEILIKAVKRINEDQTLVELNLVGDGDHLDYLKQTYSGEKGILFAGKSLDVNSEIAKADVCCFPSVYPNESLPNSVLEYMTLGKPVVSTNVGEVSNMITQNDVTCGFISAKKESESQLITFFEEKIKVYLSNRELIKEHGKLALELVKRFDIKDTADNYLKIYKKSIAS
jgi:glycosyltransferase involved in cell wall biosynthesis